MPILIPCLQLTDAILGRKRHFTNHLRSTFHAQRVTTLLTCEEILFDWQSADVASSQAPRSGDTHAVPLAARLQLVSLQGLCPATATQGLLAGGTTSMGHTARDRQVAERADRRFRLCLASLQLVQGWAFPKCLGPLEHPQRPVIQLGTLEGNAFVRGQGHQLDSQYKCSAGWAALRIVPGLRRRISSRPPTCVGSQSAAMEAKKRVASHDIQSSTRYQNRRKTHDDEECFL
mmetsp:Transcript_21870/g.53237  ORF Transcript_21870/g.53237 Transcript_21870/m.53237 type:complete len:232 (+) Transcript_21870:899-1594(+)